MFEPFVRLSLQYCRAHDSRKTGWYGLGVLLFDPTRPRHTPVLTVLHIQLHIPTCCFLSYSLHVLACSRARCREIDPSNKGAAVSAMDVGASEDGYGHKAYQRTDSGQYVDIYDKL